MLHRYEDKLVKSMEKCQKEKQRIKRKNEIHKIRKLEWQKEEEKFKKREIAVEKNENAVEKRERKMEKTVAKQKVTGERLRKERLGLEKAQMQVKRDSESMFEREAKLWQDKKNCSKRRTVLMQK